MNTVVLSGYASTGVAGGGSDSAESKELGCTLSILWEADSKEAFDTVIAECEKGKAEATIEAEAGSGMTTTTQILANLGGAGE